MIDWHAAHLSGLRSHIQMMATLAQPAPDPPVPSPYPNVIPLYETSTWQSIHAAATAYLVVPAVTIPGLGAGFDDSTSINWALANCGEVHLVGGVYALYNPVIMLPYTRLIGAGARLAGAGGSTSGGYSVLQPQSTFTPYSPTLTGAVIALDSSVAGFVNAVGWVCQDFEVDGSVGPAALPGFGIYGSAAGYRIDRTCAQAMTGPGYYWLGNTSGLGNPDGAHMSRCLAQNCQDYGFKNTPEDSAWFDCHAQGCDSGWLILGNNAFFSQCRGDTSTNTHLTGGDGFNVQATSPTIHDQPVTFVGCASETNFGNGFHVFNNPGSLASRAPVSVILSGHISQGDGVNGGVGGGSYSGLLCEGNGSRLYVASAIVNTSGDNATPPCPQYGITARATGNGPPLACKIMAGRVVGNTASSNNQAAIANYLVATGVDTT